MHAAQKMGYVLAAVSALWLGAILFVVGGDVIIRETWLGGIASIIDSLPFGIRSICFIVSWALFFMGWIVPAFVAVRKLRPSRNP